MMMVTSMSLELRQGRIKLVSDELSTKTKSVPEVLRSWIEQ